jgi:4a-hydroxytetrahydrobiopterin dehydratase
LSQLQDKNCKPCEGGVDPLDPVRARNLLHQVQGWTLGEDCRSIEREFSFRDFSWAVAFINAMAWVANQQGHHPDFAAGYDHCHVSFTTHAIGGLSENDFICAARINSLLEEES